MFIVICRISSLDALWCFASMLFLLYHNIQGAAKQLNDILKNKVDEIFCVLAYFHMDFYISYHD
jgi:hypothetical protein